MPGHAAFSLEDVFGPFDDEVVGHDERADRADVLEVGPFLARFAVLADDGVSDGRGTGDSRQAMDEHFGPGREGAREIEDFFDIRQARRVRVGAVGGVFEEGKVVPGLGCDTAHDVVAVAVLGVALFPDGDDMGPRLSHVLGKFSDAADGQVDFHGKPQ